MLPKSIVYQIADIASRAIGDALRFGSQHMAAPPRTEAGFVAAIIHRAVADIATGWAPLCAQVGLSRPELGTDR